ncbi:MAG TPA: hypothetical protein VIH90_08490 [Candidatus Saccharimonadales bacterium]
MEQSRAQKIIAIGGPCTGDIRDCEIMRSAIILQTAVSGSPEVQDFRRELARAACEECCDVYLSDVTKASSGPSNPDDEAEPLPPPPVHVWGPKFASHFWKEPKKRTSVGWGNH